ARSVIRNCYNYRLVPLLGNNAHFACIIRERIGDQIVEHDLDACAIHVAWRQVVRNAHSYRDAWVAQPLDSLHYEVLHPGRPAIEEEETSFLAREVEQVADEPRQSVGFAVDRP